MSGRPRHRDRRIAIRRAALLLFAVACLGVLTIYLRESGEGPLHSVQLNSSSLLSPVQETANKAVEPVRDSWDWATGLATARNDVTRLEEELQRTRELVVESRLTEEQLDEWRRLSALDTSGLIDDYEPITTSVEGRSVTNWYQRARLNAGRESGVVLSAPVIAPLESGQGALVGVITSVARSHSDVTFITDTDTPVGATILGKGRQPGLITSTGAGELRLTRVPRDTPVEVNDVVVTAGFLEIGLTSLYPPDIPIGQVAEDGIGVVEGDSYTTIQVKPFADPRTLRNMVILIPKSATARRRAAG